MRKIDLEAQLVAMVGIQPSPLEIVALALPDFHRLEQAQKALGRVLQLDTRALQQKNKRGGRAIEDRDFLSRHIDVQIVDAQTGAGGHHMLHRMDAHIALAQGRCHAGVHHRVRIHRNIHRLGQIDTAKHDAGIGLRGTQGQLDTLATVQSNAYGAGQRFDGTLLKHNPLILRRASL
ncbi:hypothetical protein D3C72_1397150 [compost metagenome]